MKHDISADTTLREILARYPHARPVLDGRGLDYCCGGAQPLGTAAARAGVDVSEVLAELGQLSDLKPIPGGDTVDWGREPLTKVVGHILDTHHAYLREVLPRIVQALSKVRRAHGAHHRDTLEPLNRVFLDLKAEIEAHLHKEELVLFPYIIKLDERAAGRGHLLPHHCGTVSNPIRQMEHEHSLAGQALAEMHRLTSGYCLPADACPTFALLYRDLQSMEADLHEHIHLENNILFPRAIAMEAEVANPRARE